MDQVYRFVLIRVSNKEVAEDVTSLIFDKVIDKYGTYDEKKGAISTWVFTIAHRTLIDYYRKNASRSDVELTDIHAGSDKTETLSLQSLVVDELKELTADEQALLHLRFTEEYTFLEIAQIINRKKGAVKMQLRRLLKRLEGNDKLKGIEF